MVRLSLLVLLILLGSHAQLTSVAANEPPPDARATRASDGVALVVDVLDGATIVVAIDDQRYPVRYLDIDVPVAGCFSAEATARNREVVQGQWVYLERGMSRSDDSGVLERYVYVNRGPFVNADLVRGGYARSGSDERRSGYARLFAQLEEEARTTGAGLWSTCGERR